MKIAIIDSGYKSYTYEQDLFARNGYDLKIFPSYSGDPADKIKIAEEASGILVRHTRIDREFLAAMKNLRAVVRYGVGYDNIDVPACTAAGVKVANVRGYANHAVAEHAVALMLSCTRGMWNTREQVEKMFSAPPAEDIFELHDKTLGIIGLGRIGSELSRKASSLFGHVIACDPYIPDSHFKELSVRKVDLEKLLGESDVITVHCNLTGETRHLLGKKAFWAVRKKPVVINTSRGEVIDEFALLEALNCGLIHSAGLDVFENEPLSEKQNWLVHHPRIICTGHYAWYSERSATELQRRAADNLISLLAGKNVEDCLNCL